jgi:hypothetical protein
MTTLQIRVGQHDVLVQMFRVSGAPDPEVPGIAARNEPLSVDAWPITGSELATLANAKLRDSGGDPTRHDDCAWAVCAAYMTSTHYVREARSDAERKREHARGQSAYLRGEVS